MIDLRALAATDLNLLVSLEALLEEQSVSRAAARVGVTQPAMSRTLARLRDVFGDALLVRRGRTMAPTPAAKRLAPPLAEALRGICAVFGSADAFDPEAPHVFRLAASDYAGAVLMPRLLPYITRHAPQTVVETFPLDRWASVESELALGDLDGAIGFGHDVPSPLHAQSLLTDDFVCLARQDHPVLRRRLSLRQYLRLPHLLISSRGRVTAVVDVQLRRLGLERHIAATVPHFMVAPHVLLGGDYIATVARKTAALAPAGLRAFKPPIELPTFTVVFAWHPIQGSSAAHAWLRDAIERTCVSPRAR